MSNIMLCIRALLENSWRFLMNTYIPGTHIAFGVFFVGLTLICIGFRFLSIALGVSIGEFSGAVEKYGARGSKKPKVSPARRNDVR